MTSAQRLRKWPGRSRVRMERSLRPSAMARYSALLACLRFRRHPFPVPHRRRRQPRPRHLDPSSARQSQSPTQRSRPLWRTADRGLADRKEQGGSRKQRASLHLPSPLRTTVWVGQLQRCAAAGQDPSGTKSAHPLAATGTESASANSVTLIGYRRARLRRPGYPSPRGSREAGEGGDV